jgi:transcriptional regulator with XRE-family HTH domain
MKKGRPYPPDADRRRRVRIELARRDLTISDLAFALGMHQGNLSDVINGIRLSPKTERRIAAFLDVPVEVLFPVRTLDEMEALRGRCA